MRLVWIVCILVVVDDLNNYWNNSKKNTWNVQSFRENTSFWSYTSRENRKFALHLINSHFVLSVDSSPMLNSRLSDWDQHFPGWSGWTPDSPATHTARFEPFTATIRTKNTKQQIAVKNFIFFAFVLCTYTVDCECNTTDLWQTDFVLCS